jgi:transposase-like protein
MNLLNVTRNFRTEDEALDYLIKQRWPDGVRCLACDYDQVYTIATRGKTNKPCRLFECAECKLHFSATTGTLFHDSHLPLTKWFMAMALMVEAKKGVSALQVSRHIGVAYKTAWHLCHRIRKAMQEFETTPLGGAGKIVEVDESWLGGKNHSKHKTLKEKKDAKLKILGIAERGGRVHLQRIGNAKAETLKPILKERISPETEQIVTDGSPTYWNVIPAIVPVSQHKIADHKKELEEFGELSAKTIEGAFSLFKRGVVGSYHHLSEDHLDSYLQEFCWRYNRRGMQPFMFNTLLSELTKKKPLTYKKLTRETF